MSDLSPSVLDDYVLQFYVPITFNGLDPNSLTFGKFLSSLRSLIEEEFNFKSCEYQIVRCFYGKKDL